MKLSTKIQISFYTLLVIFILFALKITSAQEELEVHFSYQAMNLAPEEYISRALSPITPGSIVKISATIFKVDSKGRITFFDPKSYEYQWYHQNNFVAGGRNVSSVIITIGEGASDSQEILVRIYDNKKRFIKDAIIKLTVDKPTVVLLQNKNGATSLAETSLIAKPASTVTVEAKPYFFSIYSLDFSWKYSGFPIENNPEEKNILKIKIPSNIDRRTHSFSLRVSNTNNPDEFVIKNFNIEIE